MFKNLLYVLIVFGFIVSVIFNCKRENPNNPINRIDLLTNDSSKIWLLCKIITPESHNIHLPSCILDDEYKFKLNGKCLIYNMGTIPATPSFFEPVICKDTVDLIDTLSWFMNVKMDTLIISTSKYTSVCSIIKLTRDSLIINREVGDTLLQMESYASKNK
jgi:hypothetical protein